ncbi:MAG: hypothetical protein F4246_11065 [Rhodothermaceae bacterium]|nr:hypothetical protein [Rhodothermaceae bacterium]MYD57539.1 hypothetical protein [Rhodothermaceae bacterium]MYI44339.1 hypothetical protein [Rhodothermaceae bacterium]
MQDIENRIAQLEHELYETKAMLYDIAMQCNIPEVTVMKASGQSPGRTGVTYSVKGLAENHVESRRKK